MMISHFHGHGWDWAAKNWRPVTSCMGQTHRCEPQKALGPVLRGSVALGSGSHVTGVKKRAVDLATLTSERNPSLASGQIKCHQPGFFWNEGSHFPSEKRYLLGGPKLVSGRSPYLDQYHHPSHPWLTFYLQKRNGLRAEISQTDYRWNLG